MRAYNELEINAKPTSVPTSNPEATAIKQVYWLASLYRTAIEENTDKVVERALNVSQFTQCAILILTFDFGRENISALGGLDIFSHDDPSSSSSGHIGGSGLDDAEAESIDLVRS